LTVNITTNMLLPDVESIWVEGDVDNGYALVSARVSSDSGNVTTNSLNVWKAHYEGLVPLESGTNQIVLSAANAAGTMTSKSFTAIRSTRFQAAITNPVFGVFATVPSNTVSGYVSALFDAGLPTQTNITSVLINGVPAVLGTNIDGNGNVPFWTTNYISLRTPTTGTINGPGIPTDPAPSLAPAESQVYEVTYKETGYDKFALSEGGDPFNLQWSVQSNCWQGTLSRNLNAQLKTAGVGSVHRVITNETDQLPSCLTVLDLDQIGWQYNSSSSSSAELSSPIDRSLSFGINFYRHGPGKEKDLVFDYSGPHSGACRSLNVSYDLRTLSRERDSGWLKFRAPRQYDTNTTVVFTFEGANYNRPNGVPLDLSQVKFHGQNPIAYSNAAQTVSYLLTVDGGKEYALAQDDFQWPAAQQPGHYSFASNSPDPCQLVKALSRAGDYVTDMHWLSWTNFHNHKLTVSDVTFSGNTGEFFEVNQDTGSAYRDGAHISHWHDANGDGKATLADGSEWRFPVCYIRNSYPHIGATFTLGSPMQKNGVQIVGAGDNGITFSATVNVNSNSFSISNVVGSATLPNTVKFYNPYKIRWRVSLDGSYWWQLNDTDNRLYVTRDAPQASPLYETVLDIACRNADGQSIESNAVAGIWSGFTGRDVARKVTDGYNHRDGVQMGYWLGGIAEGCQAFENMLTNWNGNGSCIAWSELLYEALQAQGIATEHVYKVDPMYYGGLMLVKNWTFNSTGTAPTNCIPFTHLLSEISSNPVPAQGNLSPPPAFVNHWILKYNGQWYDPSYGHGPFPSDSAWEYGSLDGFVGYCGGINVAKKCDTNTVEVTFTLWE
jgi:hypothetical protein